MGTTIRNRYRIGDVVDGTICSDEQREQPKRRPCIIVGRQDPDTWFVVGLTTKPELHYYDTHRPRRSYDHLLLGLPRRGWLWEGAPIPVPWWRLGRVYGRCYAELVDDIAEVAMMKCHPSMIDALRRVCEPGYPTDDVHTTVHCTLCDIHYRREGDEDHIACRTVLGVR